MHNHFLDKKRRYINLRDAKVQGVLPEHFADSYPKFISLLEKYYDFMDSDHSTELLSHLFAARDVNETDITLLSYIEDELLLGEAYFEGFGETESQKRAAANFSNILFRSKGTKFAIEWFFRSFYGLDAEVTYTKENIFNIGETSSRIGPESLRYITDDKLYQTFALLVRAGIPISKWRETFKLFAHPAGMYLGAEVLIDDDVILGVNTLMDALAVQQYPTPEYSITVSPSTIADEGTEFTLNVSGTDIPDGTSALYYYVEHVSTNDSDFVTPPPNFSTAAYLPITGSTASFVLPTRLDADETETQESFFIKLKDDEDREVASSIIRLNNVVPSYVMSPSNPSVDEGQPLTITVSGTDVPNDGETTLFYYVEHITTVDDDFISPPPSITNAQPFDISGSAGQFEILTKVDNVESDEQFKVHIKTEPSGGIIKDTITVTLVDAAPSFTVTADNVVEGNQVLISLLADASTIGETVDWVITGPLASDSRLGSTSGSFVVASVNQTYTLTTTTSNAGYDGDVNGTVTLTTTPSGFTSNDSFDLTDPAASYTITPSPSIGNEGGTTTFEIGGTSIPDGTVEFYIEHMTTDNSDFVGGNPPLVGNSTTVNIVGGVSSPSPSLSFVVDNELTEEEFKVFVKQGSTILTSIDYSVLGSLTYAVTASTTSVTESTSFPSYFVTTDNDGTYYYYVQGTNITADDFSAGYGSASSRQAFSTFSGSGTITLTLSEDYNREGTETFKIFISKTSSGAVVAESQTITITDTSVPTYSISSGDTTEGDTHTVIITPINATSTENIHLKITGDGVIARFPITEKTVSVDHNAAFTPVYFQTTEDPFYQGFQAGIVTARFDNASGDEVGNDSFLLKDATASYSLTTDLTNDSATEGDTINFTFSGTGIEDSDYFYRAANMRPAIVNQTVGQGTSFIYLDNTSNLTQGMETNISDIRGTITSIVSSGVQMSQGTLTTIPAGTRFHFSDVGNFDDFSSNYPATGIVTTSSNSGTFRIDVAEDSDLTSEQYSIRVYEKFGDIIQLASRTITINDTTTGARAEFSNKPTSIRTTTDDISVTVSLRLQTDGVIKSSALTTQNIQRTIGTWLNPTTNLPTNAGNYRVRAALSNWNGSTAPSGSFGSWLTLNTDRQWSITVYYPDFDADMDVTFEVQEIGNASNSDTWSVNLRAIEEYQPDDGTFEP